LTKSKTKKKCDKIPCLLFNSRSIVDKIPDLKLMLQSKKPKIVFITETWLKDYNTIPSDFLDYQPILANREKRAGGTAILIKPEFPFQNIFSGTKFQCEINHIKIKLTKNITVFNVYRPPNCSLNNTKKLFKYISKNIDKNSIICGDFNIPNKNEPMALALADLTLECDLNQHVNEPTRKNNILDLVLSNPKELVNNLFVRENFSNSDHKMIEFSINENPPRAPTNKILIRNIKKGNFNKISEQILTGNIERLLINNFETNKKYEVFATEIDKLFNEFVPLKPIKKLIKDNYPLKIKSLSKEKLRLHRLLKENPNHKHNTINFLVISRELKRQLKIFYYQKEEYLISQGKMALYNYVKNKLGDGINIPTLLDENGEVYLSNDQKCEAFANLFQKSFQSKNQKNQQILEIKPQNTLSDIDFDVYSLWELLKKLPSKNSTSPDNIPYVLLKKCSLPLAPIICEIFRIILDNGEIPELWRTSFIVPIHKKGEKTNPKNYRPISLTCTLCRVFERILANKIISFLHQNKFFSDEQYGFLNSRSTTTQLLTTMEDIYNGVQNGYQTDVIYIDFAKAFDSVPIPLLLQKVKNAGITGKLYKFIQNFLTNRTFKVKIGDKFSKSYQTFTGVPQGSVLGPLLFLIFINDLPEVLPKEIGVKMYADDVKLYIKHKNDLSRDKLVQAIFSLQNWSKRNQIDISQEKCQIIYIGKNNSKKDYHIFEKKIQQVDCVRDLGVLIDPKLSFSQHINKVIKNAYFVMHRMLKILKTRVLKTLIFAYKTYIRPQLEYATEVWNPNKKDFIKKIERVQKLFTRKALKISGLVPKSYQDRLKICELKELSDRRNITDLTMTFKIIKGYTHLKPDQFFTFTKRAKRRPLLLQTRKHTTKTQNNFFNRITQQWNRLPTQAISINRPKQFREFLKTHDLARSE
jgi:hypothetical protein